MDALDFLVAPPDRLRVGRKARGLAQYARVWSAPAHRELGAPICATLGYVVAVIAPDLPDERAEVLVRYSLWTVLLDDRIDAPGRGIADLRRVEAQVHAVLAGGGGDGFFTRELARIVADLRAWGGDGPLLDSWRDALADAVRAGVVDAQRGRYAWRRAPDLEEHLDTGGRSVNYRSFAMALLALSGTGVPVESLDTIDAALVPGCQAVRLVNDLRTAGRDARERRAGAPGLRRRDGTTTDTGDLAREVDALVRRHDEILAADPLLATTGTARALTTSLHAAVGLYRATDLERGNDRDLNRHADSGHDPGHPVPGVPRSS